MPLPDESKEMAKALRTTFEDLMQPLQTSIAAVWRGNDAPPAARVVLENQLHNIARRFVNLREVTDDEKQKFYEDVCESFGLTAERAAFPLSARTDFSAAIIERLETAPVALSYLEVHDRRNGGNCTERLRNALFQFANVVVKFDRAVTETEARELDAFKQSLFNGGRSGAAGPARSGAAAKSGAQPQAALKQEVEPEKVARPDEPVRPLEDLLHELDELVGLEKVKADVRQLINFLKVQQIRKNEGLSELPLSRHLVFYGNPGTGKTTVARLMAQVYRSLEILSRGHLVETDRSGLVAGYVGQTALKVREVVDSALEGVLFIDEAYALTPDSGGRDFGSEAIETLLKLMEDHRKDLVVIAAGYTDRMESFVEQNPGLRSRFNKFLLFEDYKPAELVAIFKSFARKAEFQLTESADAALLNLFAKLYELRDETFGNARTARNVFEIAINKQATRIVALPAVNREVLTTLTDSDIPNDEDLKASGTGAFAD